MASAVIQSRFPAGDKKIAALMHAAGKDYAERDHQNRIADEDE
jgi:hypothetical protein